MIDGKDESFMVFGWSLVVKVCMFVRFIFGWILVFLCFFCLDGSHDVSFCSFSASVFVCVFFLSAFFCFPTSLLISFVSFSSFFSSLALCVFFCGHCFFVSVCFY